MTTWFTSDSHFYHTNIIEYCKRPFQNTHEMNEALIDNWNKCVLPEDTVWHLGDFALKTNQEHIKHILSRLNGKKNIVLGNHDRPIRGGLYHLFENAHTVMQEKSMYMIQEITIEGQLIVMSHFPMETWHQSHRNSWHLHGHAHGTVPSRSNQKRLDVGVDCHQYKPICFEEIQTIMSKKLL